MSKFYTFNQNNSGGRFHFDEEAGITQYVIVEANDYEHANERAKEIGLYFDGIDSGQDCPCCGDRWYSCDESDVTREPEVYGKPFAKYVPISKWNAYQEDKMICVHYLDGRKVWA